MNRAAVGYMAATGRRMGRKRRIKPWGLVVHTSGRGIVRRARKAQADPFEFAVDYYRAQGGVHYCIGYDGQIVQMLLDNERGAHVGISRKERRHYLRGTWVGELSKRLLRMHPGVVLWRSKWPGIDSPQHLYPTRSPNGCYVGVELVPLTTKYVNATGLWFTEAQHRAVGWLGRDLAQRHKWPANWYRTGRLVGHEDIDAFARWDGRGGWDPGALRFPVRFNWGLTGLTL